MFNEILKGVDEFINGRPFTLPEITVPIANYLSLAYNIPTSSITKVTKIEMKKIPDFILVSIDCDNMQNRICDYIFYEGDFVKVISFSLRDWNKSEGNKIAMILALLGDINNSIIDSCRQYAAPQNISTSTFTDIVTYAPFIMSMGYIQNYLPFVDDKIISTIFRLMYPKITEQSIRSAKKLLSQFTVSDLLDKCIWYGVTNKEYPDIRSYELEEPKVKSAAPGKGIWNLSDMEDDEEISEEELEEDYEIEGMEEDEDYGNPELDDEVQDSFTVPLEDKDPSSKIVGYDTRKPVSFTNYPGGKDNE